MILKKSLNKVLIAIVLNMAIFHVAAEVAEFEIKPNNLQKALEAYIAKTGREVIYRIDDIKGMNSKGVNGRYEYNRALDILLESTGLQAIRDASSGAVVVKLGDNSVEQSQVEQSQIVEKLAYLEEEPTEEEADDSENVIHIFGRLKVSRDRTNDINPVLSYGQDFFESFEPDTLADIMRRIPGVLIGEGGSFRFRGTNASARGAAAFIGAEDTGRQNYDQILINGRRISSPGRDFINNYPAELIERIEVIRSPSADIDGQGSSMTVNIITKDGADLARAGVQTDWSLRYITSKPADELNGTIGHRGSVNDIVSYYVNLDFRQNLNSDLVLTGTDRQDIEFFSSSSANFFKDASDSINFNGNLSFDFADSSYLKLGARLSDEESESYSEFLDLLDNTRSSGGDSKFTENYQNASLIYERPFGENNTFEILYDYAINERESGGFSDKETNHEVQSRFKFEFENSHSLDIGINLKEQELSFEQERLDFFAIYEMNLTDTLQLQLGGRFETTEYNVKSDQAVVDGNSFFTLPESDAVTLLQPIVDALAAQSVNANTSSGDIEDVFLPSLHLRWNLADNQDVRFSLARTVRRPASFELEAAQLIEQSPEELLIRFPNLGIENEITDGVDLGYNFFFDDRRGVLGVNLFYRKIDNALQSVAARSPTAARSLLGALGNNNDRILYNIVENELQNGTVTVPVPVPDPTDPFAPPSIEQRRLGEIFTQGVGVTTVINQGEVLDNYGIELDTSFPLDIFGLPGFNIMSNVTYTERDLPGGDNTDELGLNYGFTHQLESVGISYGVTVNVIDKINSVSRLEFQDTVTQTISRASQDDIISLFVQYKLSKNMSLKLNVDNVGDVENRFFLQEETTVAGEPFDSQSESSTGIDYESWSLSLNGRF